MGLLLVKPYLGCNLNCKYCYERKYREEKKLNLRKVKSQYNLKKVFKGMEEFRNYQQVLHGGEPLVMGKKDAKKILMKMKELTGKSGIQTNGFLIDDDFIKIFKECDTAVGVSYDGPGELSRFRPGTANLDEKIRKMVEQGLRVSIIMVISKANAGNDKLLKKLKKYLLELNELKVCGRLNPCAGAPGFELGEKRLIKVYLNLAEYCFRNNLRWSPFVDIVNGLQGKSRVCTFSGCDTFHTKSATVLVGDGSISNCMRTNEKEIILRHPAEYNTRDEILEETPQEFGGCLNCKYFDACHGGCPSQAINNDWRNRSYLCPLYKSLFQFYEKTLSFFGFHPSCQKSTQGTRKDGFNRRNEDPSHGDWPNHGDSNYIDIKQKKGDAIQKKPETGYRDSEHQDGHGDWPNHKDGGHGDWPNHKDGA